MKGMRIEDIERIKGLVDILGRIDKEEGIQVWKDVGVFEDLFPREKSSVEIIHELKRG